MKDIIKGVSATDYERNEFSELTKRLIDVMVEFTLLTLHTVQTKKEAPLSPKQIEETINFDLQFRIQQINDPELLDIVRERASSIFRSEQKTTRTRSRN